MTFASVEAENDYFNTCQMECEQRQHSCDNKCRVSMSTMRFYSAREEQLYYYSCVIKCKVDAERLLGSHAHCSGKFVDCSMYGGYDPTDPCRQTCIVPRNEDMKHGEVDNGVSMADTPHSEVNAATKSIIYHGRPM